MVEQPKRARRPAWLARHLYPFDSHFVELDGCRVHYVDVGSGPLLLMLHGNPTWSFLYREVIVALSDRFRCVALDYPGFGLSRAANEYGYRPAEHARLVERFIEQLGLGDIVLMAHDWGGPIGLWVAQRQPARFSGFVLGNTFAWPLDGQRRFVSFSRFVGGPLGAVAIARFNAMVNIALPLGTSRRLSREEMRCYRRPFPTPEARLPTHVFARELLDSTHFLREVERGLQRLVDHPALLLWGERDFAFRTGERMRFEEVFPGHETILLDGASHFIQEDEPEIMAICIDEWAELALAHFL